MVSTVTFHKVRNLSTLSAVRENCTVDLVVCHRVIKCLEVPPGADPVLWGLKLVGTIFGPSLRKGI